MKTKHTKQEILEIVIETFEKTYNDYEECLADKSSPMLLERTLGGYIGLRDLIKKLEIYDYDV